MYKFVILATLVCAANAGLISAGSYAAGPALGTPLLGSVTYNAPEVTVVKQPVTIDQPEVRYHSVPKVVQTAPIVKTTVVQSPPIHHTTYVASPVVHQTVHHQTVAAPVLHHQTLAAAPVLHQSVAAPTLLSSPYYASSLNYAHHAPALTYAAY